MKIKRYLTACLAALMVVSAMAVPASAEEIVPYTSADSSFDFTFGFFGKDNTVGRAKDDKTSTYIKVETCPTNGFEVFVDGANSANAWWWDDTTTIGSPKVSRTGKFLIRQLVKEKGYSYARLGGYRSSGSGGASGKWSPDYSSLNDPYPKATSLN